MAKNLISSDTGGTGKIYVHDGISSTILLSFSSPGDEPYGLAYNGTNLISSDSIKDGIYIHDGISSTILSSFSSPAADITELAYDGANLISADSGVDKIYIHDGVSSTILSSFSSPSSGPGGLTYNGTNLISSDMASDKIYIHDGISSTILSSFSSPGADPKGLAYDGTNLISIDYFNGIYIHDGISSTILSNFSSPSTNPSGLTTAPSAAPSKPTGLKCEGQINPTNVTDQQPEFYATYDHIYGYKGKYVRIQIATDPSFSNIVWDSGKVAIPGDLVDAGTSDVYIGSSKHKFALDGTTYYWRCKFWDVSDNEGDWSYP